MNNRGITLVEVLIVIIVLGIIATFSIVNLSDVVENVSNQADEHNSEFVAKKMEEQFLLGTLIIKNNRVYNTVTKRGYSGTGLSFYADMTDVIGSRIIPVTEEARNPYNKTGDNEYKFWFKVEVDQVNIFYWDENKVSVIIAVVNI